MTNVICEEMVNRTSQAQPGWDEWGTVNAMGDFQSLYGIESAVPHASALYYLAAAGVCDIRGQYQLGAAVPARMPTLAPSTPTPAVGTIEPATTDLPAGVNPIFGVSSEVVATFVIGAVGAMVTGYFWSASRRRGKGSRTIQSPQKSDPFSREQK